MNNNQGLENIKKQLLDLFSLKKEIGRMEFCIYGVISISLYFLVLSQSSSIAYRLFGYFIGNSIISWGLIAVMVTSTICFSVFSMQRLNALKLNKNIAYIFILTALLVMMINVIEPAIYQKTRLLSSGDFWNEMYHFISDVSSYFEVAAAILSFISVILIFLLSVLKGINK